MKKLTIPSNLTAMAYESIREYILEGKLEDNTRLTEEHMATQLGISKSPVREALNRLEAEGLLRIEPRRGAYLRTLSAKEVDDLYDLREPLEVHAVNTARLTPELMETLRNHLATMRAMLAANDKVRYIQADVDFHDAIARATGNDRLVGVLASVQNHIRLTRRKTYDLSSTNAVAFHEKIVRALEAGDKDAAQQFMSAHISEVRFKLIAFLAGQRNSAAHEADQHEAD